MSSDQSFGDWLRQRRQELDLTREELARQVGCSSATLRKLEAEERRPSKQMAGRLADILQVPPDERASFLRFARGDPFAGPSNPIRPDPSQQRQVPRHNLPNQLTSFIGREKEIAELTQLLAEARLLTLTGPGGAGKTRLALQVATGVADQFPDGAWLVELAPLAELELVPQAVATVLGVREMPGRPVVETLLDHLRPKRLLLILDNCEHLIQACAELTDKVLRGCPHLSILATSREALDISGECIFKVPSLSLPDPTPSQNMEALMESAAVKLFVDRAATAMPGFALTRGNAMAVAQVCRRLDGLPLAIELAAARIRLLTVDQIAARLDDAFRLLTSGSRTALPRQKTLQALIDWSYELLPASERLLLQRLGVFVGGWTLEAAEAVGAGEGVEIGEVLDLLAQLANKSMVVIEREPDSAARYRLLETVRRYALAKLSASGETDAAWRRVAEYYIEAAKLTGAAALLDPVLARHPGLELERDNLRAALAWSQSGSGTAELGLRLAGAVMKVWLGRGHWNEARVFLEAALAAATTEGTDDAQARALVLSGLGTVEYFTGDYAIASEHMHQSLRLFRELNDRLMGGWTLNRLGGLALEQGDADGARLRYEEGLSLFREMGNTLGVAVELLSLGEVAVMEGNASQAIALLEESLALSQAYNDGFVTGWGLTTLGLAAQIQGNYTRAVRLHQESLERFREYGEPIGVPWALHGLGDTALAQGDALLAGAHFREALALFRHEGDRGGMAYCLAGLAGAAALDEEPARAARLWGAAEALRLLIGARHAPAGRATRERLMAVAREQFGETGFDAAWAEGQAMTLEQALAEALEDN
jgi:predicted ATPase/DNA-binding XRE family transcriptional regulator